jgi:hypothetical protein
MKTTAELKIKGSISFVNYALVKEQENPKQLRLLSHLFPYAGSEAMHGYVWGLYGTLATNAGLFLADALARKNALKPFVLHGWYQVDNFDLVRAQIDEEGALGSGFLHLERVRTNYRDKLRQIIVDAAPEYVRGWDPLLHEENKSLKEIVAEHPVLIKVIFENFSKINLIVHPVYQTLDKDDRRSINVATMRLIKRRITAVQVRYFEESIKVSI